jgi:hypothetical protein
MMTAKRSPSFLNIQVGTRVRIRGADQIHHKLREYANSEGVIYEAPLHPNTWFVSRAIVFSCPVAFPLAQGA